MKRKSNKSSRNISGSFCPLFLTRKRVCSGSVYFVVFDRILMICRLKTCKSLIFLLIHAEPALSGHEEKKAPFQEIWHPPRSQTAGATVQDRVHHSAPRWRSVVHHTTAGSPAVAACKVQRSPDITHEGGTQSCLHVPFRCDINRGKPSDFPQTF